MKKKIALLLFCLFSLLTNTSFSQEYEIEVSKVSGIDESIVTDVEQDINGYIWIATNKSIYRNNHKDFLKFSQEDLNLKSNHTTVDITADINGNIWYYPKNDFKLQILDTKKNKTASLSEVFPNLPFSESNIIDKIYRDLSHHIYISIKNKGLFKFDGEKITLVKLIEDENDKPIYYVNTELHNWFAYDKKIIKQNKKTLFEEIFNVDNTILSAHIFNNEAIFIEADTLPLQNFKVKKIINNKITDVFTKLNLNSFAFSAYRVFQRTNSNSYWINEEAYLTQVDKDKNVKIRIKKDDLPFKKRYRSFFVDKNNIVWILTETSLYKINLHKNNFKKYLEGYSLKSIFKRDSTIYISGFSSGLKTLDTKNKINQYNYLEDNYSFFGSIYYSDTLWISTGMRLFNHNFKTKKTIEYTKDKAVDDSNIGFGIMARHPKTKTVFIGSYFYLVNVNEDIKTASVVKKLDNFIDKKDRNRINVRSLQVSGDSLWIGTAKGLFLMNHEEKISSAITPKNGLPENLIIQYIFIEDKTTIWLGTQGQGLIKWDRTQNSFKAFTTKEGLSNNNVYAIFKDEYGFFWLPTDNGLNRFAPKTLKNQVFLPNEVSNKEFNHLSSFKDIDGKLYLGGINGLTVFNPTDFLTTNNTSYNLVLNNVKTTLKDNTIIDNSYLIENTISINSDIKSKELEFLLLDFKSNLPLQYQYKITPLHQDFIVAKSNSIILPQLDNGKYTLQVKAQSSDGTWADLKEQIHIEVTSSFLNKWMLAIFPIIIISLFFFIKKEKKKKTTILENLVEENNTLDLETFSETKQNEWLNHLNQTILKDMDSFNFGLYYLSQEMELSERQLNRRIKKLTGISPNKYITEIRLNEAFRLIKEKEVSSVKELSKKVGYNTPDYFSKLFKEKFGKKPSDFLNL
ncbi:ligand-binding sensor domain-containing protein [Polaribacter uvawellassae]|uniref:ligand-binding sensor domain-containing protein n=1 Tax=Polaribacter uvawellassae TaxID=3133495 RepID=UPI00321C3090